MQGVGFRPFVFRQAVALGLAGFVLNDSAGVLIEVEGDRDKVAELCRLLSVVRRPSPGSPPSRWDTLPDGRRIRGLPDRRERTRERCRTRP